MQPLKGTEVRRLQTNNNKVREKKNAKGLGVFAQTNGAQDYRDFINYRPGEDMLNSDLPFAGIRA